MHSARYADGSAGDADYGEIGKNYSRFRQPDPRIANFINDALGAAQRIINVGSGTGSYEPVDRDVVAVEPSLSMRLQRPPHLSAAIDAVAERLPFPDQSFEAGIATFTVHQWSDLALGLAELRRVTRGPVVVLTCDPAEVRRFWLQNYAPRVLAIEARRYPSIQTIAANLGGTVDVLDVPIPLDCKDGFNEAYYGRPERFLDEAAREACSAWSFVDRNITGRYAAHLLDDLRSGKWDEQYRELRTLPVFNGSLRMIVAR